MKTLQLLLLLLLLTASSCWRSNFSEDKPDPIYAQHDTVVYTAKTEAELVKLIEWYNQFLGKETSERSEGYAVYKVGSIVVILTTSASYRQTKEPIFYWRLPNTADIEKDYARVEKISGTTIETILTDISTDANTAGKAIKKYVVIDPCGNKVGVVNNPIYPPTMSPEPEK
ncbi:VOC family protein [Hymenobacter sediminicola]|uniref:Glyoxalase/fosfomycin resistance/dioxygenase domain-containing protein n=1 Tax=Hymenobacter sediminicola TaxID=2761579 RepID=A0A7G7W8H4_9BACT|nr:VOC family protein [Hymenobacter sediminicola]QNH62667.1 hypothetical protein H4317_02240 [Hymenobacter sediminicola]